MTSMSQLRGAIVVGNPRTMSRTQQVASAVAQNLQSRIGLGPWSNEVIELADLQSDLFRFGADAIREAKDMIMSCDLLVVASPVYKGSLTGLTKAFLDHFGRDELAAMPTVPVMIGATAEHTLAVETQLRPVLIEIGASCPTRGFFAVDSTLEMLTDHLQAWLDLWAAPCGAQIAARRQ